MDPLAVLFERFAARGDVAALGEVFDRTAKHLLHLAMHLAHSAEDAEDLLQATFVLAMKKAATFSKGEPLLPWLSGILAGEARNLARRNQHRSTEPLPDLVDTEGGPIASAERGELVARLRARVEDLPPEQRQAMLLQLQHGLSPTEIAEVLDVPPGTVRMRLHRGLQALRRLLPSALAVWLFGALPTRGLAAVRSAVLHEARVVAHGATIGGTAAIAAGALSMKYAFAGAAVVLAALLCWWSTARPDPAPVLSGARDGARVVAADPVADSAASPAAASRTAVGANDERRDDAGSLHVRVTTKHDGVPLRDVALRVCPGEQSLPLEDPSNRFARTDDAGLARFHGLPRGPWRLVATGFATPATPVTIAAGASTELALALPVHTVRGIVVDESGTPVAGAAVRVGESPSTAVPWEAASVAGRLDVTVRTAALSAADGTFTCAASDDESLVAAAHPSFRSSRSQPTHAPGVDWCRLVLLPRTTVLGGRVLDRQRQPIAGALVAARVLAAVARAADGTWTGGPLAEFATTDAAGRFQFHALPEGGAGLYASAPGHGRAESYPTTTAGGATDDFEIVLAPSIQITGVVRSADGAALHDLSVDVLRQLSGLRGLSQVATTPVHGDGRFAFARLQAPPFELLVRANAGGALLRRAVAATEERSVHVELIVPALPTLRGRVIDEGDRPLARWTVVVRDDASEAWARTDEQGGFTVPHVVGERVHVSAWWRSPTEVVELADVSRLGGEVVLRVPADRVPRASVAGRLVDHTGLPIAGAKVLLADQVAPCHDARTGGDGGFCMRGIAAGTFELLLEGDERARRRVRKVTLAATEALELGDVGVLPMATLRIEFVRTDGTPWRGWLPAAYLRRPGDNQCSWLPSAGDSSCEGAIEPGPVRIEVTDPDLLASPQDVELMPGERRVVRAAVAVGRSISLVFAGDGHHTTVEIDPKDRLHVEVTDRSGAVVLREQVRRSPHGDGNWTLDHVFAFGEYTVTARTDSDRRYRGTFVAADAMPTRTIDVPRQP